MKKFFALLPAFSMLYLSGCLAAERTTPVDEKKVDKEIEEALVENEALIISLEVIDAGISGKICRDLLNSASTKNKIPHPKDFEEFCAGFIEKAIIAIEHFYSAPVAVRGNLQVIEDVIAMDRMRADLVPKIKALQKKMESISRTQKDQR